MAFEFENLEALQAFLRPGESFALPDTPAALTGLRRLQTGAMTGLRDLMTAPTARSAAVEAALFERAKEVLDRERDRLSQTINEGTFGRGVGLSTITRDLQRDLTREYLDATGRARREAFLGAGAESRAEDAARLAAVGQSFQLGTQGLQAEAAVPLTESGREQQARETASQTALTALLRRLEREHRGGMFERELGSRESLQREAFDVARTGQLGLSIGAGIGGLAGLFGPAFA